MAIYLRVDRFRDACFGRGWVTLAHQAAEIGLSRSTLVRIMKREQMPRLDTISRILRALDATFEQLFEEIPDVPPDVPPGVPSDADTTPPAPVRKSRKRGTNQRGSGTGRGRARQRRRPRQD